MKKRIFYLFCGITGCSGFFSGIQAQDPGKDEGQNEIKADINLWEPLLQGIDLGKILEVLRPKWIEAKEKGLIKIPASTLLNQMGIPGQDKVSFMRDTRALLCQLLLAGNAEEEMIRCVSSPEELTRLGIRGINIQNFKVDADGVRRFYKAHSFQLSNVYKALMADGGLISFVAEKMKDYERFLDLDHRKIILQSVVDDAAPFLKKEVFEKIPQSSIDPVVHLGGYYIFENLSLADVFKRAESAKTKYLDDRVSQIKLSVPVIEKIMAVVTKSCSDGRKEEALENGFLEMVEPLKSDLTLRDQYAVGAQLLNSILNVKFAPQARQAFYKEIIEMSMKQNKISDVYKEVLKKISKKEDLSFVIHHIYAQPWKEENVSTMIGLLEVVQITQYFMEGATFGQIVNIMRKQENWPDQYKAFPLRVGEKTLIHHLSKSLDLVPLAIKKDDLQYILSFLPQFFKTSDFAVNSNATFVKKLVKHISVPEFMKYLEKAYSADSNPASEKFGQLLTTAFLENTSLTQNQLEQVIFWLHCGKTDFRGSLDLVGAIMGQEAFHKKMYGNLSSYSGISDSDLLRFLKPMFKEDLQKKITDMFSEEISCCLLEEYEQGGIDFGIGRYLAQVPKGRLTQQGEQLCDHVTRYYLRWEPEEIACEGFSAIFLNLQEKIGLENLSKMIDHFEKSDLSAVEFDQREKAEKLLENMKKIKKTYDPT